MRDGFFQTLKEIRKAFVPGLSLIERSFIKLFMREAIIPSFWENAIQGKKMVLNLIDSLKLDTEHLILGGFSQGAILASLISVMDFVPKRLLLLSGGSSIPKRKFPVKERKDRLKKAFQSHGMKDLTIPILAAKNLKQFMEHYGWEVDFHSFKGGHELPLEVIKTLSSYLEKELKE